MIPPSLNTSDLAYDALHHRRYAPGRSLIGNVLNSLAHRILSGELRPGDTIANESEMMAELGISRTTLREAIKVLSGKGLLESRQRHGTRVLARNRWNLLDADVLAWMMASANPTEFTRELLEIRRIFEPDVAALAAERATDADIAAVARACIAMEANHIDSEEFVRADAAFHDALLVAARNQFLVGLGNGIRASLIMFLRYTTEEPSAFELGRPFHRAVFDRVVAHDPEGARRAMIELLDGAQQVLDRLAKKNGANKSKRRRADRQR